MQTIRVLGDGPLAGKIFYASYESFRSKFGEEFCEDEKFWFLDEKIGQFTNLTLDFYIDGRLRTFGYDDDFCPSVVTSEWFYVDPNDLETFYKIINNNGVLFE